MPLFKRNPSSKLEIPPVDETVPDGRSTPDLRSLRDKYSRSDGVGDAYTRGGERGFEQLDQDRNELFSGYNPASGSGSGRFFDGPDIDEEDDVEAIKKKTRFVKQESVKSTQNGGRLAREAVETGESTLRRLGEQSEKLGNAEHDLNLTKGHILRADDKTEELRKLNRSIFMPAVTINNDAKHAAHDAKAQRLYEEGRALREQSRIDSRDRLSAAGGPPAGIAPSQRSRFRAEATESDDEIEDELERNLDEIHSLVGKMRTLGTSMRDELDRQNGMLARMDGNAAKLDGKLQQSTVKLRRAGGD